MIISFEGNTPNINNDALVFDTATIIGKVDIEKNVSIWPSAVLRGDTNSICVQEGSNVQDNATVHTSDDYPVNIGKGVTVGHNAIIHGCTIKDNVLVGMGAVVLDGAIIEIAGNTDPNPVSDPTDEYNLKLSYQRAEAVKQYFVMNGVSPDRIVTVGRGSSNPIVENDTEEHRAMNRRTDVSFKIIEQ